jgi:hypothetical protein
MLLSDERFFLASHGVLRFGADPLDHYVEPSVYSGRLCRPNVQRLFQGAVSEDLEIFEGVGEGVCHGDRHHQPQVYNGPCLVLHQVIASLCVIAFEFYKLRISEFAP